MIHDPEAETTFSFFPPLWQQRRFHVTKILREHKVTRVLDLGTGQGRLLQFLKFEEAITELVGVDSDLPSLELAVANCEPRIYDHISFSHPLTIQFYRGDITVPDERFVDVEAAACVEVMEHLEVDHLEKFAQSVFGCMRPRLLVLTTPNAEYNVTFSNLMTDQFRDADHKFEWTRHQFESWCNDIATTYLYRVTFSGVGEPPLERQEVGFCTQIATFIKDSEENRQTEDIGRPYILFEEMKYEYKPRLAKKILSTLCYHYSFICEESQNEYVRLERLWKTDSVQQLFKSEAELKTFLEQSNTFEWSDDGDSILLIYKDSEDEGECDDGTREE